MNSKKQFNVDDLKQEYQRYGLTFVLKEWGRVSCIYSVFEEDIIKGYEVHKVRVEGKSVILTSNMKWFFDTFEEAQELLELFEKTYE